MDYQNTAEALQLQRLLLAADLQRIYAVFEADSLRMQQNFTAARNALMNERARLDSALAESERRYHEESARLSQAFTVVQDQQDRLYADAAMNISEAQCVYYDTVTRIQNSAASLGIADLPPPDVLTPFSP